MPTMPVMRGRGPARGPVTRTSTGYGAGSVAPVAGGRVRGMGGTVGRGSVYGAADPKLKRSLKGAAKHLRQTAREQMRARGPKSVNLMPGRGRGPRRRGSVMTGRSRGKPYRSY